MTTSPDDNQLLDPELELTVRRLADDLDYGSDPSPYVGAGVEYAQSRPFVDGDSVRDIDWRVTARTGRVHVKEYEVLKSMPIYLLLDTSASMNFASHSTSKHQLAVEIAGGLALAGMRRHSPVGIIGCGERLLHFTPSLSRQKIFQWLQDLHLKRYDECTNLTKRVEEVGGILRSRCLVVVISDLHEPDCLDAIKRTASRHDCMVLQILDPAEQGALRAGFFRAAEAETGVGFVAHGRSRWFDSEDPAIKARTLASAGVDHLLLRTDKPYLLGLRRFVSRRNSVWRNTR